MPTPARKRRDASRPKNTKRKIARKAAGKKARARPEPLRRAAAERPSAQEEAAFTDALIRSGEAARLDDEGKLPLGATHKIVEDKAGNVSVVRRRFSIS